MTSSKRFLLMMALIILWSPSFLFIKLALNDFPPVTLVALRVSVAAVALMGILAWKKVALPKSWLFWVRISGMAFFASVVPFCLIAYAEQSIDTALAAILNGASPMFTALLAQMFIASDKMDRQKALGVFLSCSGVILLFAPKLQEGVSGSTLGMAAALLAALSYATSHIYGKLYSTGLKPFVAPTALMIVASAMLWPLAIYNEQVFSLPMPTMTGVSAICGLAFFGTVLGFAVYYKLLEHCGPTAISSVACFFPVGGMVLGFIFLDESFTSTALYASAIIFLGMLLVNEVVRLDFLRGKDALIVNELNQEKL